MIPLILAGIGISVFAYWAQRKLRHKPVTLGGLVTAAVVGGATGGFGGPVVDTLFAAPLFAAEGAISGEVENDIAKPVEGLFAHFFGHHSNPAGTKTENGNPNPISTNGQVPMGDGTAGSSGTAIGGAAGSSGTPSDPSHGGNSATMPPGGGTAGGGGVAPTSSNNTIGITYTVRSGDTFYSIARRANVTESSLLAVNPTVGSDMQIRAGQILNIPCPNIDAAGPGAPKSAGCVATLDKAFGVSH